MWTFLKKAALAATMACVIGTAASANDKVTFQFSWIPTGDFAVYSAGIEKGFYKEQGIDLDVFANGRGSGDAIKKVAGSAAMFGDGDIGSLIAARLNEKAPLKCVVIQHDQSPHAVFALASSGIKGIKDLAGKTLATTAGNSHYLYFPYVAKMAGLDPATVKWINVDSTALGPSLIAKRVDGAPLFASHAYYIGKEAKKQGEELVVLPYADAGFKIYSYCLYTTETLINSNPDLVKRFVAATVKSFLWTRENMDEAVAIHHKKYPDIAADDAKGSLKIMFDYIFPNGKEISGFGKVDMERLAFTYKVAAEAQKLRTDADINEFVEMRFLPSSGN